jgi:long-subunit fatty acid transport protein
MKKNFSRLAFVLCAVLWGMAAQAGGFEKNIMWSGKQSGTGGAAISTVTGAEALVFNPSRLAYGSHSQDISVNISPTSSQYSAPIKLNGESAPTDRDETSEQNVSPIFGLLYRYQVNDSLGLGIGYYVSGGTSVEYKDVPVGDRIEETFKSSLSISEFSVGAGYKINEAWSIGGA